MLLVWAPLWSCWTIALCEWSIVEARVCPVQDTSCYVPLWLRVTDELAILLTFDILTQFMNCVITPFVIIIRGMCLPCPGHRLILVWASAELLVNWCSFTEAKITRARLHKEGTLCHVINVIKQSRDNYVICLPLWHVGTRKWTNMKQLLLTNIKWKMMHKLNKKIWSLAWTVLFSRIFLIRGKLKGQRELWKKISIYRWLTFKTECVKILTGFVWLSNNLSCTQ